MVISCWSAKGGSGTTVVACGLALVLARRPGAAVVLVDVAGDAGVVLGADDPAGPGLLGWARAGTDAPADALGRLAVPVGPGLELLPRGEGSWADVAPPRLDLLAAMLAADDRTVVIDCGLVEPDGPGAVLAASATSSLLVTRACYVSLRRAVSAPLRPSSVVLVREAGRALDRADVEGVLGVPVVAEVPADPSIARAVDAGLLMSRLPRGLQRALVDAA